MQDVASESERRVSPEDNALIEAAAALRPVIRGYQAEIERERRLPPALVALYFITQFGYQNYPETPALIRDLGALTTLPAHLADYTFHPNTVATMLLIVIPLVAARAISSACRSTPW